MLYKLLCLLLLGMRLLRLMPLAVPSMLRCTKHTRERTCRAARA